MGEQAFELLIIGGGPAGQSAASAAAEQGVRVALVERNKLGGTCHNYGCDPTKTLLHSAHTLYEARHAGHLGVVVEGAKADWARVRARVRQVLEQMQGGSHEDAWRTIEQQGVTLFHGNAAFASPHTLRVGGQTLRAERFILAPGTVAAVPEVEGLHDAGFITNVEAVALPELPRSIAILGSGPIGVEFAQLFARMGVTVTVLEREETPLGTEDRELGLLLCDLLGDEGVRIEVGVDLERVTREGQAKRLHLRRSDGSSLTITADEILVAVGRQPALDGLNLEAAGVETHKKGIVVDATLRTSAPHIWACGDIAGRYQFTHVAEEQGQLAAHNACASAAQPFDERAIPWVTYTSPELAHVGQTEEELREAGTSYRVARAPFVKNDRALTTGRTEGLVKLLVGDDGALLGGHILGAGAGELIAPIVLAMRAGLIVRQLADAILPYPTYAAAVRTAAQQL